MPSTPTLRPFADAIDTQDWDTLRTMLAPDFHGLFVQDGRTFDADSFVAFQRDYPGRWRFEVVEHLVSGDRVVARSRVSDGEQVFWVATFATVTDGLVSDLVEVWTEAVTGPGKVAG
ncbi:nuclear transport factor 2 family protein [Lapillicoccus sp.]|uniref:nuclear transport factor 2 family protein n=1 Tax=Lapillicoccus sp. TaxID=1909287 RepID=UPI0025E159A2|nr:nuclear transport factor 2 family protein [Lapillicoccus sp.]